MKFKQFSSIFFAAFFLLLFGNTQSVQAQTSVDWRGWSFDYDVSGSYDGLSLSDVKYNGTQILQKASFPVMRVFYDNNACGPYADRLGGTLTRVEWAGNVNIVNREITINGERWREIGIQDTIGAYVMYQVWYLSENGVIDGHIFAKGLQCNITHLHYPYWRMDFDLAGGGNDQVRRFINGSWQTMTTEFTTGAGSASGHQWQVRDTVTGDKVDVEFGTNIWNVPGEVIPVASYNNNNVHVRRYRSSEDRGWTYGANSDVPYDNNENIDSQDIVLWYDGYMRHTAAEGPSLWHSLGVRFVVDLNDGPTPTPTNIPPPSTPVNTPLPGSNTPLVNANFSNDTSGFNYQDNTFRSTSRGSYVSGSRISSGAYNGSAGLRVLLGGIDDADIVNMSGGWRVNFNVPSTVPVNLSFRYNLTQASEYENDEYSQVMASVDGTLYGTSGNDYIQQIAGDGNGGPPRSTGWQTFSVNLGTLSAGNHTLVIGGFSNKKTLRDELTTLLFDDVRINADLSQIPTATSTSTSTPPPTATPVPTNTPTATATSTTTPTNTPTNTPLPNNTLPVVENPGNQENTVGNTINLSIFASDIDDDSLSFSASNLPIDVVINPTTGQIVGTPSIAGTYNTVITVSDGIDSVNTSFTWVIQPAPPVQDSILKVGTSTVGVNSTTSVNVGISSGDVEIGAAILELTYDANLINVVECQSSDFQTNCDLDNSGLVSITGVSSGGVNGDSNLVTLTVEGISAGTTSLNISSVSTFTDINGNSVGYIPQNGQIVVNAVAATPSPTLTPVSTPLPPVGCGPLEQEAEDGTLVGSFLREADSNASGGEYVYTLDSTPDIWNGSDGANYVTFCVTVPTDGTYRIKAVSSANDTSADSFYVQVDGEPVNGYIWDTPQSTSFTSSYVGDRNGTNPVEVPLTAGNHTITFSLRESGTKLDKFALEVIENVELPTEGCFGLEREAEAGILSGDFAVVNDSAAAGGAYIEIPQGNRTEWTGLNTTRRADYCFTVDEAGTYKLEGIVAGPNELSDSFYVRVNDEPAAGYLWDTANTSTFVTDNMSDRSGANPVLLTLEPGIQYVTIYAREDGSKLDKLALRLDSAVVVDPPQFCSGLSREAEDGLLRGGLVIGNDPVASGGQYVHVPNGIDDEWDGLNDQRRADFCFTVDQAGTYAINTKVYAADDTEDSFYVRVNNEPAAGYLWDTQINSNYEQDYVSDRNIVDPVTVSLPAGEHIVSFYVREIGTRLDSITLEPIANDLLVAELNTNDPEPLMAMGIYGTIFLESGSSIASINRDAIDLTQFSVSLVDAATSGQQYSRTVNLDSSGAYRIENMTEGEYLLTLNVPDGFESMMPANQSVSLSSENFERVSPDVLKVFSPTSLFLPLLWD